MCLSSVLLNLTLSAILRTGGSSLVMLFVGGVCSGGKSGEHGAVKGSGELVFKEEPLCYSHCHNTIFFSTFKIKIFKVFFKIFFTSVGRSSQQLESASPKVRSPSPWMSPPPSLSSTGLVMEPSASLLVSTSAHHQSDHLLRP
ncbi:hypothetical protein ALC60_10981 [Trachymyrmex zeteki]|uniref:Secreted protein n=1 Tax=Mycetomoellerius zeteki TaxID=64791 RepID=A0A151WPY4_9HYME|nr:hypothetical protein ALC60_10981 [Trachymyrmex zeteki]